MTDTAAEIPPAVRMQQLLSGFEVSQALYVIAELGVATALLDGPHTVKELAAATGADPDALGRIIRFLASLGVFLTDRETVMRSFQPELAGQRGWCGRSWWCSAWWVPVGIVHDHLSAGGVLAGQDEQGA